MERAEVVIIGGGIMGASLAFALTNLGISDVLVLEKRLVAAGASGKTGALLRQHYGNRPEATLAHQSLQIFKQWGEIVGGSCGYDPCGLIVTVDTNGPAAVNIEHLQANVTLQQSVGIRTTVLTAAELQELQPFATFDDIAVAAYEAESGTVDGVAATEGLLAAACARGVRVREGVAVTALTTTGGRITGVETTTGPIAADLVVCAAGAWAAPLLETAEVTVPLDPIRVQIAVVKRPTTLPANGMVAYVDTAANQFSRNWGPYRTLVGVGGGEGHESVDPDDYDERIDRTFPQRALDNLARRVPAMVQATLVSGCACLYDMTPDAHPIIGPAPGVAGLYLCVGFSGAGFKKGPAIGQALAEQIVQGQAPFVDLTPFRLERFATAGWQKPWGDHEYLLSSDFGHTF